MSQKVAKPGPVCPVSYSRFLLSVFCGMLFTRATLIVSRYFVFCLLVVLVRLSVPVQVIDWKDSSPK